MKTKETFDQFTVICTVNNENNKSFNFQVKGWHTEKQCEKLINKYAKGNLFIDYVSGYTGEQVSCNIHAKFI